MKMNKYQEAYYWIEKCYYGSNQGYFNEEQLLLIKELVDKETPMKPKVFDSVPRARCNICNNGIRTYSDSNQIKYCHWCGQVIDWNNNEKE